MTDEQHAQYVKGRYAEMLTYYDQRSVRNKRTYRILSWYVIVVSGFLAPLVAIKEVRESILPPFLTASVGVAAAILGHSRFHENWLLYRATWDRLKQELQLHSAKIGPYEEATDTNALFVLRVEALITGEGQEWRAKNSAQDDHRQKRPTPARPTEGRTNQERGSEATESVK